MMAQLSNIISSEYHLPCFMLYKKWSTSLYKIYHLLEILLTDIVGILLLDFCFLLIEQAKRNAKMKAEMNEKTMRKFPVSQKHIVYTEPLEIHAGTTIDVLYNPSNTVLTGKPEVWFRCSFNRWMYPGGVLPPQKMVQAENGSHLKATCSKFPNYCS